MPPPYKSSVCLALFVGCGRGFGGFIFCVRDELRGQAPALHLGVFREGLLTDRRKRYAVRLVDAGNSMHAHGFVLFDCFAHALFFANCPRFSLLWSLVLTSYRRCFVRPTNSVCRVWTASPMREAPPLALPATLSRKGGRKARFALCFAFLLCFVGGTSFPNACQLWTASAIEGSAPRAPRKPAGARLDRALRFALCLAFLLCFVGGTAFPNACQ